jgi:hypothetical protein
MGCSRLNQVRNSDKNKYPNRTFEIAVELCRPEGPILSAQADRPGDAKTGRNATLKRSFNKDHRTANGPFRAEFSHA